MISPAVFAHSSAWETGLIVTFTCSYSQWIKCTIIRVLYSLKMNWELRRFSENFNSWVPVLGCLQRYCHLVQNHWKAQNFVLYSLLIYPLFLHIYSFNIRTHHVVPRWNSCLRNQNIWDSLVCKLGCWVFVCLFKISVKLGVKIVEELWPKRSW